VDVVAADLGDGATVEDDVAGEQIEGDGPQGVEIDGRPDLIGIGERLGREVGGRAGDVIFGGEAGRGLDVFDETEVEDLATSRRVPVRVRRMFPGLMSR
jgi:hypothetical protein